MHDKNEKTIAPSSVRLFSMSIALGYQKLRPIAPITTESFPFLACTREPVEHPGLGRWRFLFENEDHEGITAKDFKDEELFSPSAQIRFPERRTSVDGNQYVVRFHSVLEQYF